MKQLQVGQSASPQGLVSSSTVAHDPLNSMVKVARVLWKGVYGTTAAAALLIAGLAATSPLGSVEALFAQIQPAQSFQTAPEQVRWIRSPTSVMIEAGRTAEGGLDVRKMMEAWRDAGMSASDVPEAMKIAGRTRPILMGRVDRQAEMEHGRDMSQAQAQLEHQFHDVLVNMVKGTTVSVLQEDQGYWKDAINRVELSLAHDVSLGDKVEGASLNQQFQMIQDWNASQPDDRKVKLPKFLEFAQTPDGSYSADYFLDVMKRSGIHPENALSLYEYALSSTTPLDGLPVAMVEEKREEISKIDRDIEDELQPGALTLLRLASANPALTLPQTTQGEYAQLIAELWQELEERVKSEVPQAVKPIVSMQQATKALEDAIVETGLRSFAPSLWQLRSPQSLMEVAINLKIANQELSHATGWKGKVLGLDGRVELSMGPMLEDHDAAAVVWADTSGRLQMASNWGLMGHEWAHAYDHVAGREVLQKPGQRPMSENIYLLRSVNDQTVKQAFANLNESLTDGSPEWQSQREAADDLKNSYYFRRGTEVLAYGFGAYLTNSGAKILGRDKIYENSYLEPYRVPSTQEQAHQKEYFSQVFQATSHLGLSGDRPQLKMKAINQWRDQKMVMVENQVEAHTLPENRHPTLR